MIAAYPGCQHVKTDQTRKIVKEILSTMGAQKTAIFRWAARFSLKVAEQFEVIRAIVLEDSPLVSPSKLRNNSSQILRRKSGKVVIK